MDRMRSPLLFSSLTLCFVSLACGGNVSVSGSGGGGTGGGTATGGSGGTTTTPTISTTSTTNLAEVTACTGPGQCTLVFPGCCAPCQKPELGTLFAVNKDKAAAYLQFICPDPVPCPACDPPPNPNLFAYCKDGTCAAADVRNEAFSECSSDAQCRLRDTAGCCENCVAAEYELIAVQTNADQVLKALVCAPDEGCSKCLPQYPPGASAVCGESGHCAVSGVNF